MQQKRIRKIAAPQFSFAHKRSNLNVVKNGGAKAAPSAAAARMQNNANTQDKSNEGAKDKDLQSNGAGSKNNSSTNVDAMNTDPSPQASSGTSRIVVKKNAATPAQGSKMAGGYTPTIIARNQFVPNNSGGQAQSNDQPANNVGSGQPLWANNAQNDGTVTES